MIPIKGFVKNSMIEWEGKIVSIVFLSRCNLRCRYCHAPHLVCNPNELETIPLSPILESVVRNKDWLDGVVISGGEPTLCGELDELINAFRGIGLQVKLDTNGTNPCVLESLLRDGLLDYVAMDIKAPLEKQMYEDVAGVELDIDDIKRSIAVLIDSGIDHEFRTTVCPTFLDKGDVEDIARSIKGADKYFIQQFRTNICLDSTLRNVTPYPDEVLEDFAAVAGKYVNRCWIRGREKVVADRNW